MKDDRQNGIGGKRQVYENIKPAAEQSESAGSTAENIDINNLSAVLDDLKGKKLTEKQYENAKKVLDAGVEEDMQKLLKITKRLADGTYDGEAFELRLATILEGGPGKENG